ncbi:MAG: succinylglutamate desuccinylase, partial [Pseudomonadota bacterium]|nr:succinylglutamate desuccinylase [Pseudomonadota bacterium]
DETNVSVWRHLKTHYAHMMPWGCRSLTLELRGENDISHELAEKDASALMKYLILRDVVAGEKPKLKKQKVTFYPLDAMDLVKAPVAGIACFHKSLGEPVEAGEVIGEVIDLMADDVTQSAHPLIARANGVFFARFQRRLVVCGESIAKIAGREHLAFREIGHLFED